MKLSRTCALALILGVVISTAFLRVALAEDVPAPPEAAAGDAEGVGPGPSGSFEATASYHNVDKPYFQPGAAHWGEGFARARVNYGLPSGAYFSAGGTVMTTVKTDYYGTKDRNDGLLDQLLFSAADVGGSGFGLTVGRQGMTLGDGFLVGDGYRDHFAALWNIPLSFYDGVLATWTKGPHHVTAFAADLSPSFTETYEDLSGPVTLTPDGAIFGGEFGWSPSEGNELALAFVKRNDTSDLDHNPQAFSLRGAWRRGAFAFAGEGVLESGRRGDLDLSGRGGHVNVTWTGEGPLKPVLKAEYFLFSGDDPETDDAYEGYDPLQFTWSDWSHYYVGDLLSSTVGTSSDMRIAMLQAGITPREGTGLRLLAHRFDHDRGDTRPFAYEFDAVLDQAVGEHWSGWLMAAYATPLDAAKLEWGEETCVQVFAAASFKFSGRFVH